MMTKLLVKYKHILIHIVVWMVFMTTVFTHIIFDRGILTYDFLIRIISSIVLFYVNFLVLVPKLLLKNKVLLYVFYALIIIIVYTLISHYIFSDSIHHHIQQLDAKTALKIRPPIRFMRYLFPALFLILIFGIGAAIQLYIEWRKHEKHQDEIKAVKVSSELHFLKNQLNPHFLFNSLNSIYSLTTQKSNDAPEAVITLSELMRYMLYQTNNDYVLLANELDYIQNYIKLQRLRLQANSNVNVYIKGNVSNQKIRPLLLISFIENAFKHGTDFKGNTEVNIHIKIEEHILYFSCENLIGNRKHNLESFGIGLKNTEGRIALLYQNKHKLSFTEKENKFIVDLTLNLA